MPRKPRNIGASVRARLLDRARAERSDFQILLTRYALERLLYRLSVSAHRERFILKGAMLFVTWVADPFRPTRDLDLLGFGDNGAAALADTFRAICAEPVADDSVTFDSALRSSIDMPRGTFSTRAVFCRSTDSTGAGSKPPCWPSAPADGAIGGPCQSTPSKVTRASFVKSSRSACRATDFPARATSTSGYEKPWCFAGKSSRFSLI